MSHKPCINVSTRRCIIMFVLLPACLTPADAHSTSLNPRVTRNALQCATQGLATWLICQCLLTCLQTSTGCAQRCLSPMHCSIAQPAPSRVSQCHVYISVPARLSADKY